MVTTDAPAEVETISNASWSPIRIAWSVATGVILVVAAVVVVPSEWRFALFPQDEGLLLAYPSLILHGWQPNRSFESVYGVVNLWVLGGAFKIGGASVDVERAVGALYRLIIVGSLFTLALRRRGPVAALCAGLLCVIVLAGTIGLAAFAWLAGLAFGALALVLADLGLAGAPRRSMVVLSGMCFGFMVGCRLDLVVAGGLALVVVAWLRPNARRLLGLGAATGLVPLIVNLVQAGPVAVIDQQLLTPIFVTGPARRLPLSTLGWQGISLLVLCAATGVALVALGWRAVRADRSVWDGVLLMAIGLFDLGLLPQGLQRSDGVHLALLACWVAPSAVMLPALGFNRSSEEGSRTGTINLGSVVVPVVVAVASLVLVAGTFGRIWWTALPAVGTPVPEYVVTHGGRSVPMASAETAQQLRAILAAIDARAHTGQKLFVGPHDLTTAGYADTYLYYLLPELLPATRYLEMDPGVANGKNSTLADELRNADFLILNSAYDAFPDADPNTRHGSAAPNEVVARDFTPVTTSGTWTLYQRK